MSTFVIIHGAGDSGWSWHLVAKQLTSLGHTVVAPDLLADDDSRSLSDYAADVVESVKNHEDFVVVGHSFGGFTAPLVADQLAAKALVLVAGMIPSPGESPNEWWGTTGFNAAVKAQSAIDGGLTGNEDPFISFYHDVPRFLAEEAIAHGRSHPSATAMSQPWPLIAWPDIPTRFILCSDDRFFPADFFRRLVPERLGIDPEEIQGSHCVMLSNPDALALMLAN